jgi:glycosyltransferase involved in cell wall biosynthesis
MNNKLAIVIPAYKSTYFEKTLQSIASQTNKNFVLYIGNDAGDNYINIIVSKYTNKLKIVYKKFEYNIGRESLIKQWNRCVEMVGDEKYVWFFSDDDIMDINCVQLFYDELSRSKCAFNLYRFNTNIIDESDNVIVDNVIHPLIENSNEFALMRFKFERISAACEFIFDINEYKKINGFVEFPLGWCSDDATWISIASETGIKTIDGGKVSWRQSKFNISNRINTQKEKKRALKYFLLWYFNQPYLIKNNLVKNVQKHWIYEHYHHYLNEHNIFEWINLTLFLMKLHNDSLFSNIIYLIKYFRNDARQILKLKLAKR